MKKEILICKNCKLYDSEAKTRLVTILRDNEKFELHTEPNDKCIWEANGIEVQEIRVWSDGKNGYVQTTDSSLDKSCI